VSKRIFKLDTTRLTMVALAVAVLGGVGACTTTISTSPNSKSSATAAGASSGGASAGSSQGSGKGVSGSPIVVEKTVAPGMFQAPSGNIACDMTNDGVTCQIQTVTWTVPGRPADCVDGQYGARWKIGAAGKGTPLCTSDSMLSPALTVLEYAHAWRVKQFVCTSSMTNLRCQNDTTGHGFTLAKEAYSAF
jgi:Family of unknown function (DUF6636)